MCSSEDGFSIELMHSMIGVGPDRGDTLEYIFDTNEFQLLSYQTGQTGFTWYFIWIK